MLRERRARRRDGRIQYILSAPPSPLHLKLQPPPLPNTCCTHPLPLPPSFTVSCLLSASRPEAKHRPAIVLENACSAIDQTPPHPLSRGGGRRPRGVGITAWSTRMGRLGAMNISINFSPTNSLFWRPPLPPPPSSNQYFENNLILCRCTRGHTLRIVAYKMKHSKRSSGCGSE